MTKRIFNIIARVLRRLCVATLAPPRNRNIAPPLTLGTLHRLDRSARVASASHTRRVDVPFEAPRLSTTRNASPAKKNARGIVPTCSPRPAPRRRQTRRRTETMSHGVMAWRGAVRAVSSTTASTSSFAGVTRRIGVGGAAKCGGGGARRMAIHARDPGDEERVTSTDNATVKHFAKLVKSKAHRDASGSVVVAGAGMLEEIYADGGVEDARVVFLGEDAETPRGMRARRIVRAPEHVLKKAAGLQSVDRVDVVAELATPPLDGIEALGGVASTATRVLALDGIQDPGNLGTLTRTALALGWDAVALLPGTCDPFNDKVMARARVSAHPIRTLPVGRTTRSRVDRRPSTVATFA